jgi:AraC-like DNA-binding protein
MTEAGAWERGDARLEKAKGWIDEHPCERLDPDGLAEMVGLSEKYFRSLFKHRYGMTPFEYQIKARLEYARFLLAESGQSVKQVALSTGYPDPYSFSKQFKQVMGYPPVRLRRDRF